VAAKHAEVASIDDACLLRRLVHEVPEMGIELGRPAGDIHGMGARPVERAKTKVGSLAIHLLRAAVGAGVDVAVPASHVAEFSEVDLEYLHDVRPQDAVPIFEGPIEISA
jgi:hypothetical protein